MDTNRFRNYPEYAQIVMAPVVGQLTDDNNDLLIDWRDYPDIAIIADDAGANESVRGILRIIGGRNGIELKEFVGETLDDGTQVYPYRYSNIALADIDQDSQPELVFLVRLYGRSKQRHRSTTSRAHIRHPRRHCWPRGLRRQRQRQPYSATTTQPTTH